MAVRTGRPLTRIAFAGLFLTTMILLAPYLRHTSYQSVQTQVFSGESWYNPYAQLQDVHLRANFHAHSRAWLGLTWGENTAEELIHAYAGEGYDVPALSNYHMIAKPELYGENQIYIPVYEHGFNLKKVHCLCIGAQRVTYLEYPWHASINHTRQIIYHLKKHCDLVALAHPGARNAHVPEDMVHFAAMDLMEVANTQGVRTEFWDEMLSAGHAVWFLANDDTHDLMDEEAFMRWNIILVSEATPEQVIQALREGKSYGIASYDGEWENNQLREVSVTGDTLRIHTTLPFNRIDFIGQDGRSLHSMSRESSATYVLRPEDTYVRTEIHHDHSVMYLNPVIRYDGVVPPFNVHRIPQINVFMTWAIRSVVLLLIGVITFFWIRMLKNNNVIKDL